MLIAMIRTRFRSDQLRINGARVGASVLIIQARAQPSHSCEWPPARIPFRTRRFARPGLCCRPIPRERSGEGCCEYKDYADEADVVSSLNVPTDVNHLGDVPGAGSAECLAERIERTLET